jgi:hypothetical protein
MRRNTAIAISVEIEVDDFLPELPFEDALLWYERELLEKEVIEIICRRYNLVPERRMR